MASEASSALETPDESRPLTPAAKRDMEITTDLENLQSDEQRRVLDVVARVQKCGLKGVLSFPQLVVCGDQSAGKSSVLEALTGVPFPRSDNLCTRYATEINLRRANNDTLTIKVIPDENRPANERDLINAFTETISDFDDLPRVMDLAMQQMGVGKDLNAMGKSRAFARDVLSIIIEGPTRPQLTLVDIPGLIANDSRGVTKEDVKLVEAITDSYINNPRTICLAVVAATNDYANQKILSKVREVDPDGKRTLGIVTKPDGPPPGSGSEKNFIELALNQDITFELGWHVVKNRKFEEMHFSLMERNIAEDTFFATSNWKVIPKSNLGIDNLRKRLSIVLFEHVKNELPKLRKELDTTLGECQKQLDQLGIGRSTTAQCKTYLSELSQNFSTICRDAVNGHYEDDYFLLEMDDSFDLRAASTIRRTRAVVQNLNAKFARKLELDGHKYEIRTKGEATVESESDDESDSSQIDDPSYLTEDDETSPVDLTHSAALDWVKKALVRNRGKELIGNFNPLLIGELFREQAGHWKQFATSHVESVHEICCNFLKQLLRDKSIEDVESRLWSTQIEEALEGRKKNAMNELAKIIEEVQSHPINYNHYYTETIAGCRTERLKSHVEDCAKLATKESSYYSLKDKQAVSVESTNIDKMVRLVAEKHESDMELWACSEALDCLLAIYKVSLKVFVANVTTQVIERHIVKGLENIFSPIVVNAMSDEAVEAIAAEPLTTRRKREFLTDRVAKLKNGRDVFKTVMGGRGSAR